ncbi:hypothetical protein TNCV_785371 [Trichonephila clavipes]|nr:hypothetical protein TNCV_785371 [Trichonephila clavipes]
MEEPVMSPDLVPVGYVWEIFGRSITARREAELKNALVQERFGFLAKACLTSNISPLLTMQDKTSRKARKKLASLYLIVTPVKNALFSKGKQKNEKYDKKKQQQSKKAQRNKQV